MSPPRKKQLQPAIGEGNLILSEEITLLLLRHGIRDTAMLGGVSARTLRRRFQEHGVTPRDCMIGARRELSLKLIATNLSLATVAHRLGFSTSQSLARFVHREFGTTSTRLRKHLQALG